MIENTYSLNSLVRGQIRFSEPMKFHTSFRIGGPAKVLAIPADIEDIKKLILYANRVDIPWYVIGNGTNLLVADEGIRGIVIKISKVLDDIRFSGQKVIVGAGASLSFSSKKAAEKGLSGLEFGIGIPGTIGGAVAMNAGCGGQDISQVLQKVKVINNKGDRLEIAADECQFGYRRSRFQRDDLIVVEAELLLELLLDEENHIAIKERMSKLMQKRRKTQPLNYPNAGSIFKNPEGDFAGRLIEAAGCKGMTIGDAMVSQLHANFIVNRGKATAKDVIALITKVQDTVKSKFNILLDTEVTILK